jgi:hypothetical protein
VYPLFTAIDTNQSSSGAPLRLPLRVGIHCLQLRCVIDLHCIPVEIFPNARLHFRLYRPTWISQRITNRLQQRLHVICYRIGELIFPIRFEPFCCPCRLQTIRRRHCRLLFFARILHRARFAYVTSYVSLRHSVRHHFFLKTRPTFAPPPRRQSSPDRPATRTATNPHTKPSCTLSLRRDHLRTTVFVNCEFTSCLS